MRVRHRALLDVATSALLVIGLAGSPLVEIAHAQGTRHAWCEVHGHLVDLTGAAEALGPRRALGTAPVASTAPAASGSHQSCPFHLAASGQHAVPAATAASVSLPRTAPAPYASPESHDDARLLRAPKHGPPSA
ncbi:MAG: hypothetical protein D6729_11685 [Deltaproteobacteria bacterium]|nr:MAG: hypothetical protein D6729_11685 [Deltaproteobacteria bacterium]